MNYHEIMERLKMLEFHQKLLLKMVKETNLGFYRLIVEKSLTQTEVNDLLLACENLSKDLQKQKAEGFVNFHPLFDKFNAILPPKLRSGEIIPACLEQGLYVPLMMELKRYLKD
ncbi:DUF1878 family protein [Mesobacillus foraminis]|uniref:Uncharacterized protein DUF1878 n=1 Tax=Mesobacillus foraminis TaxID=279826 RepID=A0A4R2BPU2_9BACI|nr:DUF1878 family protein [Mesobacillus foraminis]TCN27974.1 uncharacterized protein DUF1878 [Mesobacillus foraminis]